MNKHNFLKQKYSCQK